MVYGQDTQVFWRWVTGVPLVFIEQYRTLAFHLPTVSTCPNRSIDLPPPVIDYSKVPFETECVGCKEVIWCIMLPKLAAHYLEYMAQHPMSCPDY